MSDSRPEEKLGKETPPEKQPIGSVLVVGAGIAGMQSSLDLAEMGYKVYLLESKPSIGGVVPQLDKTFPTNDCAMCILAPKLVETGRHPNISIMINSRLEAVTGEPGHFRAKVRRRATYIDPERCNGCGECTTVCPVDLPSEHDEGLAIRKAVYRRYPQAIPNTFAIDKRAISPCRTACPAGINVHGYVALIRAGKFGESYRLITEAMPFPGVCGRACHHPCELVCNRKEIDAPISIRNLKRFVSDQVAVSGMPPHPKPVEPVEPVGAKVAVVGAGPAGLTVAKELKLRGFGVKVFDGAKAAGGMITQCIPAYRLPDEMVQQEIRQILDLGVELELNCPMDGGKLEGLLKEEFQAAVIAIGAQKGAKIPLAGADHKDCLEAIDFLRKAKAGEELKLGKRVIVVGGGNVSMDVARVAKRLGAEEVHLVCLEARRQMPAHPWEQEEALDEGVIFHTSRGPARIVVDGDRLTGLETVSCRSVFDAEGRFKPDLVKGTEEVLAGDTVILAVGQAIDSSPFKDLVETDPRGRIKVDPISFVTSQPNIFSCGDVVTGPASIVQAVGAGRAVAESVSRAVAGASLTEGRQPIDIETAKARADYRIRAPRVEPETAAPAERVKDWREIERTFTPEEAVQEASRCLNCGGCSACMQCYYTCKREAVNHQDTDKELEIEVGAVLLSPGFEKWDPSEKLGYGYGQTPNVLTSPEFERILSASGPFGGHLQRPSDSTTPKRIAFLQCIGSRDEKAGCRYCSSVCCMFATKEAVIAIEHEPQVSCDIFFMDMRAYGKGFEKYYQRAKDQYKVAFRRNRVATVEPLPNQDLAVKYIDSDGRIQTEIYNMVVLAVGMRPSKSLPELAAITGATLNQEGFLATRPFEKESTEQPGIFASGAATEPMDIPETVTRASAAAGAVAELLSPSRGTLARHIEYPAEHDITEEEPRIGVFVCACGINIGGVVDVKAVAEYARQFPGVVHSEVNLYTCSQDTQVNIKAKVEEHKLNRVLVASCTPRTHESLFQNTIHEKGINPFLFEFVSLREQVSWVHPRDKAAATQKAKSLLAMGLARCVSLKPVVKQSFPVLPVGMVIGGGVAGMTAALSLAEQGFAVHLLEKGETLGGHALHLQQTIEGERVGAFLAQLKDKVQNHPKISVHTGKTLENLKGYVGNYEAYISNQSEPLAVGALIIATGGREVRPTAYGYGELPQVVTQTEFEAVLENTAEAKKIRSVVMIQCVGSRDGQHPYCSRVCCTQAVKNALRLKAANPKAQVKVLYRDMRTYGFREEYYQQARKAGVLFVRYEPEQPPVVSATADSKGVEVRVRDQVLGEDLTLAPDKVVLSTGIEAGDNFALSQVCKTPLDGDGFFLEAHAKLRPLEFATDGIFLAGLAHSPKLLFEAVSQARGAAAKAATLLSKASIQAKGRTVAVAPRICSGCGLCVVVCPYEARFIDQETGKAAVIEVLCQGCGACAAVCPNSATQHNGFESSQILAQIDAALM